MLDKFLALLERFVVAHELIAANSTPKTGSGSVYGPRLNKNGKEEFGPYEKGYWNDEGFETELGYLKASSEILLEGVKKGTVIESGDDGSKSKAKHEEDDLADDEAPEEKPKTRKPRATKPKAEPEPDLDKLREEISVMAKHIGSGDSDDCADELDDLMAEYDVRSVKKLGDLQVQEFHKELKAIVAKYYDIEE